MPISGELGIVRLTATEQRSSLGVMHGHLREPHFSIDFFAPRVLAMLRVEEAMHFV
jgi:hypothetical protein